MSTTRGRLLEASQLRYSDSVDVTVTKDGHSYQGVAFAVQNDHSIRCEVRKALPNGQRLTANETPTGV